MATPGKFQDAAAAALSAIEVALNVGASPRSRGGEEGQPTPPSPGGVVSQSGKMAQMDGTVEPAEPADAGDEATQTQPELSVTKDTGQNPALNLQLPGSGRDGRETTAASRALKAPAVQPAARRLPRGASPSAPAKAAVAPAATPANDDRRTVGELRQALQFRPNRSVLVFTLLSIIAWAALWATFVYLNQTDIIDAVGGSFLAPKPILTLLALFGPIVFFLVVGVMARRAQEMRLVANSMAEVAIRLIEPEAIATEQVVTLSQAIRREAASMGDGIERALARAGELEIMVRAEVSNLERSYSDNERRIRLLIDELAREREAIVVNANNARTALFGARDSLSQDITATSAHLTEAVSEASSRLTATLGAKEQEIKIALEGVGDNFGQTLSTHGTDVVARLATTGDEVARHLGAATEDVGRHLVEGIAEFDRRLQTTGEALATRVAEHGDHVSAVLSERLDAFEASVARHGGDMASRLAEHVGHIDSLLTERTTALETAGAHLSGLQERLGQEFDAQGEGLRASLSQSVADASAALAGHSATMHERFATTANEAVVAIATQGERVNEVLVERLAAFEATVGDRGGDIAATLAAHGERISKELGEKLEIFEHTVIQDGGTIAARIDEHSQRLMNAVDERLSAIDETIAGRGGALVERLDAHTNEMAARLGEHSQRFVREVGETVSAINKTMATDGAALVGKLGERADEIASIMSNKIEAFEAISNAKTREAADRIEGLVDRIDSGLNASGKTLKETLTKHAIDVARVLGESGREVIHLLDARIKDIDDVLLARSTQLAQTLSSKAEEINSTLGGRAEEIEGTLDGKISLFQTKIVDRLQAVSSEIDERSRLVVETIGTRIAEINSTLAASRRDLDTMLHARTGDLSEVSRELTSVGELVTKAMVSANEKLRAELPAVLDQLSQTNVSLQTIVDAARTYLASLETDLNRRLQEFHGAMGAVATQINQIGDVAGGTMRDASAVVGAIEEQHKSLSQSAGRLAQSQGALDQALDARKRALENLVVMIEDKRSDFEGVLSGFSDMVENSLRHVEAGARDIGGFLTQSTQETAHLVDERFAEVRAAAAKERERTAAAMRAAYDQANSELTQTFGHASEKFAAAAAEIRGLASEIQRELEATRVEVRRGAVELPRETAEQASALRRVVGDQVRALNELTDIVARSGRVYDIAEPAAAPPPLRSFEAPGAAPLFARARSEPPQPAEPAWRATRPLPPLSTDGALENRGDQGGQGWLSGLLARASRDEAAAPRRSAPSRDAGALDSLTLDIARMVDHAAVVDLWERFQRGERGGLFGRRLYTAQGLRTYEEIRRRYRSDLEFHATVDHYIQEFERLLMETSRNDPDGSQARSYLASDAGKVYTMLSHASGRFD